MKGPKLNTAPKVWSHESHIEEDSHFPCHAGHIISDAGQDAIGLLDHLDTVVARASQHPVVLFCQATFQPHFPELTLLPGDIIKHVEHVVFSLFEYIQLNATHQSSLCRSLCRAYQPSRRSTLLPNLASSTNLLRVHLTPSSVSLIKILNKMLSHEILKNKFRFAKIERKICEFKVV